MTQGRRSCIATTLLLAAPAYAQDHDTVIEDNLIAEPEGNSTLIMEVDNI